jgi:AcrR family transcriptional regulator
MTSSHERACPLSNGPEFTFHLVDNQLGVLAVKRTAPARQEQRQQTRARLVEAAMHVFAHRGYDHATVEEISLAAGYSKGAYYFHFDSKEGIFLELISNWIEEQTSRLRAFEGFPGPAAVALLDSLESLLRYEDRDPDWRLLLPEIWAQSHRNAKVQEALQTAYARWIDLLRSIFEKADREGLVSLTVRPSVAASLVLAAHDGLVLRSRLRAPSEVELPASQIVAGLVAVIAPSEQATKSSIPPTLKRTVRRKR